MSRAPRRQPFVGFCTEVLGLELTPAWRALLTVTIDGVQPRALRGKDREIARELFGDVDEIDPRVRRVLVWRLGRASGKSTIAAALAIYGAWTADLSRVGRGQVAHAFVVSPSKPISKIAVGIARALVVGTPLERHVVNRADSSDGFMLRRIDTRVVAIRCVAASKGGANLRGVDVVVLVLDESEFFASGEVGDFAITDRDQLAAAMPRLIESALLISTPWPSENVTGELFERNFGKPQDAVAALGTSMQMRPSDRLARDIENEMSRDEETARREYFCEAGPRGGSHIFVEGLKDAVEPGRALTITAPAGSSVGAGGDLGLERDASAVAIVAKHAASSGQDEFALVEFDEVRPAKGSPLAPGYVVRERFAPVMRRHGCRSIMLDAHYRQSAVEHLGAEGLKFDEAPDGNQGKYDSYMFLRGLLRAGHLHLPNSARLLAQLRAVVATPIAGGKTRITSPRRAGSGHGDLVSALVLAVWSAEHGSRRYQGGGRTFLGGVATWSGADLTVGGEYTRINQKNYYLVDGKLVIE